jgi:hypothetical protein
MNRRARRVLRSAVRGIGFGAILAIGLQICFVAGAVVGLTTSTHQKAALVGAV